MKKYVLYTIVIVVAFLSMIFLLKMCTNKMIEVSDYKEETTITKNNIQFDLEKPIKDYDLDSYEAWEEYIEYLLDKIDFKFSNLIDKNETILYNYKHSNDNQNRNGKKFIDLYMNTAYIRVLNGVYHPNGDWSNYPLTDNFIKKFNEKEGVGKYYNIPEENKEQNFISSVDINTYMKTITVDAYEVMDIYHNIYGKYDKYHLYYTLDENGYIDNIVLDKIEPVSDENGNYILKKDKYLMTDIDAKSVIYNVCLYDSYFIKHSYIDYNIEYSDWKMDIEETGMTDKFRDYFIKNDGILPNKDFSSLEVINVDIDKHLSLVKIELDSKYIFYDIYWTVDNEFRLDTVEVKINHEENK